MIRILSLILAASVLSPWLICAATTGAAAVGSCAPSNPIAPSGRIIHQSNMYHVAPHALISSIISDIHRHSLSSLSIDVSSSRLNDAGTLSLIGELLAHMQSKLMGADQSEMKQTLLVKLSAAMNNLTPSGVSRVIDLLLSKEEEEEQTGMNGATKEVEPCLDGLIDGLRNERNYEQATNDASLDEPTPVDSSLDTTTQGIKDHPVMIEELDLSYNDIGGHGSHALNVQLLSSVRRLFEGGGGGGVTAAFVPRVLILENCGIGPAFCRSIGRGILNAFEGKRRTANFEHRPSALHLGGNNAIGDAGSVALAAALRMAKGYSCTSNHILNELDLSSCNVGDAGAEALALALASNPSCVRRLDLSNNKISDSGAISLGRALVDASRSTDVIFENIILDNNRGISDDGAVALAEAWACGAVKSISLRSCSVGSHGTAAFGKAIVSLASRTNQCHHFLLDLSGNHFGTRKIAKKGGVAGRLRDKASTNIKFIGKTLKGAAKRFSSETMGITADSDDDEEIMGGLIEEDDEEIDCDKLLSCGGHAFAGELINSTQKKGAFSHVHVSVGMRQCSLDDGAIDALSASIIGEGNYELSIDVSMNSVEDSVVYELMHGKRSSKVLAKRAQRHMDFMDRIANAHQHQSDSDESGIVFGSYSDDEDLSDFGI